MKLISGYLVAVLVAYLFGAVFVSQGNIAAVIEMGFQITLEQRFDAILHDISNMYDIYLLLIAIALMIALPIAALIIPRFLRFRLIVYVLAGFFAMIVTHLLLKAVLGVSGIAPTRDLIGLIAQGVSGGIGGMAFHFTTKSSFRNDKY